MTETGAYTMTAMVTMGHGDLDKLVLHTDWPRPVPQAGEVLIRVRACGLNNTDVNTRSGWYSKTVSQATTGGPFEQVGQDDPTWGGAPITFPRIQGADICGEIVAVGADVDRKRLGQRVITDNWLRDPTDPLNMDKTGYFGSERDGGFAQYTTIPATNALDINAPHFTDVQLAKLRGATVIAMAAAAKHADVAALGPDLVLNRSPDNLRAALGNHKITVVADVVGGPYWPNLIDILERGGRYVCSGAIAGPMVDFDLRTFYLRDLTFLGSTVIDPQVTHNLVRYIEQAQIKPVLAATYPLSDLARAQAAFISKNDTGNIVVIPE